MYDNASAGQGIAIGNDTKHVNTRDFRSFQGVIAFRQCIISLRPKSIKNGRPAQSLREPSLTKTKQKTKRKIHFFSLALKPKNHLGLEPHKTKAILK